MAASLVRQPFCIEIRLLAPAFGCIEWIAIWFAFVHFPLLFLFSNRYLSFFYNYSFSALINHSLFRVDWLTCLLICFLLLTGNFLPKRCLVAIRNIVNWQTAAFAFIAVPTFIFLLFLVCINLLTARLVVPTYRLNLSRCFSLFTIYFYLDSSYKTPIYGHVPTYCFIITIWCVSRCWSVFRRQFCLSVASAAGLEIRLLINALIPSMLSFFIVSLSSLCFSAISYGIILNFNDCKHSMESIFSNCDCERWYCIV